MGWAPGTIISLDDPERIGRVQVRCELIDEGTILPNANDGWCWVLEDFILPTKVGGSHRMLKVGSQVALLPMMGDPRQMLILGCIPSRRDRPSPLTDRFDETYGAITANGVVEIADDRELSHGIAYPHGVFQHVSPTGDITYQTQDNARLQLQHDGGCRMENDTCFSALSPDGVVQQGNDSGAYSRLDPSGEIAHKSPSGSGITFGELEVLATGPASGVSKLVRDARKRFGGRLGECVRSIDELKQALTFISEQDFLNHAPRIVQLLDKVLSLSDVLDEGNSILDKISNFTPEDLAKIVAPQVDMCLDLNLEELLPEIEGVIISERGGSVADAVIELLPDNLKERVRPELIDKIATIFAGDKEMAAKAILHEVVPMGVGAISNMFGLNLQKNLGGLSKAIDGIRTLQDLVRTPGISPINLGSFAGELVQKAGLLKGLFPSKFTKFLPDGVMEYVLGIPEASDFSPLQLAVGFITNGVAKDTKESLSRVEPALSKLKAVKEIFKQKDLYEKGVTPELLEVFKGLGAKQGLDWESVEYRGMAQYLKEVAAPILAEIEQPVLESVGTFNQLIDSIPDDKAGVRFSLTESSGEIAANGVGLGGRMEVTPDGGKMVGPDKFTSLSVGNGAARIGSILGGLNLENKGLKVAADVLDFMQIGIDKLDVVVGMKKGFQVKISPLRGISIGLNGIPELPDLSLLAKELLGSEEIAKAKEAFDRIKQVVEGGDGGEGGGSEGGGIGKVSFNLNESGISAGSEKGPSINILDDRIGVAGVDHLPFVTHTHEIINHTIGNLDHTMDCVVAFHFPWVSEEYGTNWRELVRENFFEPERVIQYLAPLEGNAGLYLAQLIYKRLDRLVHEWDKFGFKPPEPPEEEEEDVNEN